MPVDDKMESPTEDPERLLSARLAIVYSQGRLAMVISPLIGVIASYALWPEARHDILTGWVIALAAFSVLRTVLADRYHKNRDGSHNVRYWERLFVFTLIGISSTWGVGGWLVMLQVNPVNQALLYYFLIITAAGALTSYGAHAPSSVIVLSLILGPATLYMLYVGDRFHVAMGLAALFFAIVALRGIRLVSNAFGKVVLLADELEKLSRIDSLSGLYNRRAFTEFSEIALASASRSSRPCAMLVLDIDNFKSINDRLGHAAGDLVIRALGDMLSSTVRANEFAARLGGDEFAVILPDTSLEQGNQVANRVLKLVHTLRPSLNDDKINFTVSIGISVSEGAEWDFDELFACADDALYDAKHAGRDRVIARSQCNNRKNIALGA